MPVTHAGPIDHHPAFQPNWGVDTDIEQAVRVLLAEMPASETSYIAVTAHEGVVTLDGTVSDSPWMARFKNRITSAMPGITINDRLEWVLPDCGVGLA